MFLNKPIEQSTSLVEGAVQSAEQAIKSTQQAASDALESLTVALQDLSHQATPAIERAGDKVSSLAHRGLDNVRETSHQLRVKAEHASDNTVNYIRHEPVKSVIIAAATGAALMALISLVSHARSR
ncbi:MAG: hypothetical protein KAX57_11040 [Rhodoferax sp.]|jgi:ElaB/YqjD/DUF883 family membrane-anchored ribosome-binding protein|uniref:hypothetical protein n=1 Tax=Rhodoferax sp. TaxID=50421 RepID=UPI001B587675|nr:hypothetical protein [Rhodoferax sp.]MBP8287355.1 hypothetical protein [Rhodoferax sp.]MBP9150315.1 hypothetical protein [Rhodoferax sp.]MBP9735693.1 hypothetical protein [Rhodoferax sp.]